MGRILMDCTTCDIISDLRDEIDSLKKENEDLLEFAIDAYWSLIGEMPASMLESERARLQTFGVSFNKWGFPRSVKKG